MKQISALLASFLLLSTPLLAQATDSSLLIDKILKAYKKTSPDCPATAIVKYSIASQDYYYVRYTQCADYYNSLYDGDGNYVCAPDGGITGRGDGKCPSLDWPHRVDQGTVWKIKKALK